jgi:hypothetical protein
MPEIDDLPVTHTELPDTACPPGFDDRRPHFHFRENEDRAAPRNSQWLVLLTAPVIYALVLPLILLDAFLAIYQAVCFPVYGIPQVKRSDYLMHGRRHLQYLDSIERLNCEYCAYANGLAAYFKEIAGRTEQYWCPIKHARRMQSPHSRYSRFVDFGDADAYRRQSGKLRRDFVDLETLTLSEKKPQ